MSNKSDKEFNIRIGRLLQAARESQHVSQADISRATGISKNHISGIERGTSKMSVELLLGYCDILKMTPNEILGYDNTAINPSLRAEIESLTPDEQTKLKDFIALLKNF